MTDWILSCPSLWLRLWLSLSLTVTIISGLYMRSLMRLTSLRLEFVGLSCCFNIFYKYMHVCISSICSMYAYMYVCMYVCAQNSTQYTEPFSMYVYTHTYRTCIYTDTHTQGQCRTGERATHSESDCYREGDAFWVWLLQRRRRILSLIAKEKATHSESDCYREGDAFWVQSLQRRRRILSLIAKEKATHSESDCYRESDAFWVWLLQRRRRILSLIAT